MSSFLAYNKEKIISYGSIKYRYMEKAWIQTPEGVLWIPAMM